MPAEKFYDAAKTEGDIPDITVAWGGPPGTAVFINGVQYDRSALNRLIKSLRKARDQVYGADE